MITLTGSKLTEVPTTLLVHRGKQYQKLEWVGHDIDEIESTYAVLSASQSDIEGVVFVSMRLPEGDAPGRLIVLLDRGSPGKAKGGPSLRFRLLEIIKQHIPENLEYMIPTLARFLSEYLQASGASSKPINHG
jgi:hypothetical protein